MACLSLSSRMFHQFLRGKCSLRRMGTNVQEETCPLMVNEILQQLNLKDRQVVLDMTFGDGFHTEAILHNNESVNVIALDRDPCAIQRAEALADKYPGRVTPLLGRFSDLPLLLRPLGIKKSSLDAITFDLGCSSIQLNDANRGFSPELDGPLDMRMDGAQASGNITALDVILRADENDLKRILRIYGGEEQGKKLARAIVTCRYTLQNLDSTQQFRDFIETVCEDKRIRAVRNVFYAIRSFVNNEINELNYAMVLASEYLKPGGRIVSLTFNQLEDTIVKRHITGNVLENSPNPVPLKYYSASLNLSSDEINALRSSQWSPISKHVITPSSQEKLKSYRSQMAKLRGAVKL